MQLTHLGHACLLVETGGSRILIDPGDLAGHWDAVRDLDAVLVTHQHADHLDVARLPALLAANGDAALLAEPESTEVLHAAGIAAEPLAAGSPVSVGGVTVTPVGSRHAFNHDGVPGIGNLGVVLRADGEPALFHPGDALDAEPGAVDILAVPLNAPWAAVRDTIGFVRRIAARHAVPVHDALLSEVGRRGYLAHVATHGGTEVLDLAGRGPVVVPA